MSCQANNPKVKHPKTATDLTSAINNSNNSLKNIPNEEPIVREIPCCLTTCSQCTGVYVDIISGRMLRIFCRHSCHYTRA